MVIDDHLLRGILTGGRPPDLGGLAPDGVATTGLWLFRLCSSLADPAVAGRLSAPVTALLAEAQARLRAQLTALPDEIEVPSMRDISWTKAVLQHRHRNEGCRMSAAMIEALAAAHWLDAGIAGWEQDGGPNLRAAAEADGISFHAL